MAQIPANGLSFEYEEFGKPDDPAVLMIMGLGAQMIFWPRELCQGIADQGFRVIRFDNRDIGLSSKLHGAKAPSLVLLGLLKRFGYVMKVPYTVSDMAQDVVAIMDGLEIEKAHIVGASMGGIISQVLGLHHPHRLYSITTIFAPTCNPKHSVTDKKVLKALLKRPKDDGQLATRLRNGIALVELIAGTKYPPDDKTKASLRASIERSFYPAGMTRQAAAIIAEPCLAERLQKMDVRLLAIQGDADPLVLPGNGHDIAKNAPNATLVMIEGMGHTIPDKLVPDFVRLITGHMKA